MSRGRKVLLLTVTFGFSMWKLLVDVERLRPKFHPSNSLTNLERSGHGQIELPGAGAGNRALADISERAERRQRECGGIEIIAGGSCRHTGSADS